MKTLLLLRHAKSSWGDSDLRDFDRPLKEKGRAGAALIGAHLAVTGCRPDAIISSPALRARQTAECIVEALIDTGTAPVMSFNPDLYEAPVEAILRVARSLDGDPAVVMLVGHNPSMHMAALRFSAEGEPALRAALSDNFPTAGLASFTFDLARWSDISWFNAKPLDFVFPKALRDNSPASAGNS